LRRDQWYRDFLKTITQGVSGYIVQPLYPSSCAGCGIPGDWFCARCLDQVHPDYSPGCLRCGRRGRPKDGCAQCDSLFPSRLARLRAGFVLDGPVRRAIHRFKYLGEYQRGRDLGERLAGRLTELSFQPDAIDALVPVPLHPRRSRQRGFNQAAILADVIADKHELRTMHAVRRSRNTVSQTSLNEVLRAQNVAGAFAPEAEMMGMMAGKRVTIIDDVATTGATISEVATVLEEMGAESIDALVLAREQ
jgi:ComF family protein